MSVSLGQGAKGSRMTFDVYSLNVKHLHNTSLVSSDPVDNRLAMQSEFWNIRRMPAFSSTET